MHTLCIHTLRVCILFIASIYVRSYIMIQSKNITRTRVLSSQYTTRVRPQHEHCNMLLLLSTTLEQYYSSRVVVLEEYAYYELVLVYILLISRTSSKVCIIWVLQLATKSRSTYQSSTLLSSSMHTVCTMDNTSRSMHIMHRVLLSYASQEARTIVYECWLVYKWIRNTRQWTTD